MADPVSGGGPVPRWTPYEDALLHDLHRVGLPPREIARRIGRTNAAVSNRLLVVARRPEPIPERRCRCGTRLSKFNVNPQCWACIEREQQDARLAL